MRTVLITHTLLEIWIHLRTLSTACPLGVRFVEARNSQLLVAPSSFVKVRLKANEEFFMKDSTVLQPRHWVQFGSVYFGTCREAFGEGPHKSDLWSAESLPLTLSL